ncbi:MAG: hypothetical protein U5J98_06910 [Halobacteriales archaeon]|nr:hypothetical protein [Halobacteriales archaeon]
MVEFDNIDWQANTFDVYINKHKYLSDVSFENTDSELDELKVINDNGNAAGTVNIKFDTVEAGGSRYSPARFSGGGFDGFEDGEITDVATGWSGWKGGGVGVTRGRN